MTLRKSGSKHLSFTLLLLLFLLGGCSRQEAEPQDPNRQLRIVSLIPSATELIYELGAGELLVGVTENDDYPPEVKSLPRVGDQTVNLELLLKLKPSLVVCDSAFNKDLGQLRRLGFELLILKSERLSDIEENLAILGARLDRDERAAEAIRDFRQSLEQIKPIPASPSVFLEVWSAPLMTAGGDTLLNDLLSVLDCRNIYGDTPGYFVVEPEDLITRQPDLVLQTQEQTESGSKAQYLLDTVGRPTLVLSVEGTALTRPSPRILKALESLREEIQRSLVDAI